jgi:hypothetical protein
LLAAAVERAVAAGGIAEPGIDELLALDADVRAWSMATRPTVATAPSLPA